MESFLDLFTYGFIRNAFIAGLFASIACGITGTYIISRRIVFISGGITHASFGGIGIGYFLGINPILGAAVFSIMTGLGIEFFSRKISIREDAVIAMLWSFGMAIGVIFIYITPGYAPNLMTYLFGSILTVSAIDLYFLSGLSILIILVFIFFYRTILFIAFDEDFSLTRKLPVNNINYLLMGFISLTIVFNIRVVGIILVLSLLTIPQTIAMLYKKDFKSIIWLSIIIGFVGNICGLLVSYLLNIPSGASIIFFLIIMYMVAKMWDILRKKIRLGISGA